MRTHLLFFLLLSISAFTFAQNDFRDRTIKILPESRLTITGDTNIKDFTCVFDTSCLDEQEEVRYTRSGSSLKFENTILRLESSGFDCGNKAINKDFHQLIKSSQYPEILLELKEVNIQRPDLALATVLISIAGKEKEYQLPVELSEPNAQAIKGALDLDIKDFDLSPPKKLFGLIVVKDDIKINFDLRIRK